MDSVELLKKGFSGVIYQYVSTAIITILGILITVKLVRSLTIEEFGIYNFIFSIIVLAQILTSLGLIQVIQRYLPEYKEKRDNRSQKKLVNKALLIRLTAGFVFASILLVYNHKVISLFHLPGYAKDLFLIIAFIALLDSESQLLGDAVLLALLEIKYWNLSKIVYSIVRFILFYYVISTGYGLAGVLWAWLIVEVLLFLLFLIRVNKLIFSLPVEREGVKEKFDMKFIRLGGFIYLNDLMYLFKDKASDVFFLLYFIGAKAVGLYSFAFGIPYAIMQFSIGSKLRGMLNPLLIRRYATTGRREDISYYFMLINRLIFFTMIPLFIAVIILADKIILYVFKPEYIKVGNLFVLSLGFMAIQQFVYPYTAILITLEKGKIIFTSSLISLYNLLLDIILIPIFGVMGAILATGSAGVILIFYYHFAIKKSILLVYPWRSFAKCSFNIFFAALAIFFMKRFIFDIFSLFFTLLTGGVIFLVASYINKCFEDKDRQVINKATGSRLWVF